MNQPPQVNSMISISGKEFYINVYKKKFAQLKFFSDDLNNFQMNGDRSPRSSYAQ